MLDPSLSLGKGKNNNGSEYSYNNAYGDIKNDHKSHPPLPSRAVIVKEVRRRPNLSIFFAWVPTSTSTENLASETGQIQMVLTSVGSMVHWWLGHLGLLMQKSWKLD